MVVTGGGERAGGGVGSPIGYRCQVKRRAGNIGGDRQYLRAGRGFERVENPDAAIETVNILIHHQGIAARGKCLGAASRGVKTEGEKGGFIQPAGGEIAEGHAARIPVVDKGLSQRPAVTTDVSGRRGPKGVNGSIERKISPGCGRGLEGHPVHGYRISVTVNGHGISGRSGNS